MYKTGHAFTCLLLKECVANDVINVSLFACCEPGHRRVEASLSACLDAESGHFEHYRPTYDCCSQNNNVKMAAL